MTLILITHKTKTAQQILAEQVQKNHEWIEKARRLKHGTQTGRMDFETGGTKPPTGRGRHDVSTEFRDAAGKWTKGGSTPAAKPAEKDPHGHLSFDLDGDLTSPSTSVILNNGSQEIEPKTEEKKMPDNMMMYKLPFRDGIDLDVAIDKPLENEAGRVTMGGLSAKIELNPDPILREKGITKIKSVIERKSVEGKDVLFVDTNKGKVGMLLSTRPDVVALLDNKKTIQAQCEARRNEFFAAERAESKKEDQVYIGAMDTKAAELAKQIPAGNIPVEVKATGHFDGQNMYSAIIDGEPVSPSQVTVHGWATATYPGALNPFQEKCVASASPEQLAKIRSERKAESDKKSADTAKRDSENRAMKEKSDKIKAAASCKVLRTGIEGEERDPFALVEMTDPTTGEKLQFRCRNISDAGYAVNPTYAVAAGEKPGGLATANPETGQKEWSSFKAGTGWTGVRPLTPFENACLDYLHAFPPISTGIRM